MPAGLLGLSADPSLLEAGPETLPADIPHAPAPAGPDAAGLERAGSVASTLAILAGAVLVALSAAELIADSLLRSAAALVLGVLLAGSHRGWARAAAARARTLAERNRRALSDARREWLAAIEPYPRFEVTTVAREDGSIEIVRARYAPIRSAGEHFRFERTIQSRERHDPEQPGAAVVERAEDLRRAAALETGRERERFLELLDAHSSAALSAAQEHDRNTLLRAGADALSAQINAHLREPPLSG